MPKVLLIDDDRTIHHLMDKTLTGQDIEVHKVRDAEGGLEVLAELRPDVVLLDIMLPGMSGLDCFREVRRLSPRVPVIFVTSADSSETAIQAMQLGAYDYLTKPLDKARLRSLVEQAIETHRRMQVPVGISPAGATSGDQMVGRSDAMLAVYTAVGRVADQDVTVLIRGESGTGKELVARAIYQHSPRSGAPFLAVNCAALPDTLLESELFGHEKGAFTGAECRRIGKFEQCSGGTIFLDEVGDMAPLVQGKVLRLLQEQKFERVGGNETIETDVRIIAATNRNLEDMVEDGEFRSDLLYRLNGFTIQLPPLRNRGKDLDLLIEHFLLRLGNELEKKQVEGISADAAAILRNYSWPGNVRELQSVIRRSLLNATTPVIVPESLPSGLENARPNREPAAAETSFAGDTPEIDLPGLIDTRLAQNSTDLYAECLEQMERFLLVRVLAATGGNQSQAARILGITRGRLRNRIRALNISIEQVVSLEEPVTAKSSDALT